MLFYIARIHLWQILKVEKNADAKTRALIRPNSMHKYLSMAIMPGIDEDPVFFEWRRPCLSRALIICTGSKKVGGTVGAKFSI